MTNQLWVESVGGQIGCGNACVVKAKWFKTMPVTAFCLLHWVLRIRWCLSVLQWISPHKTVSVYGFGNCIPRWSLCWKATGFYLWLFLKFTKQPIFQWIYSPLIQKNKQPTRLLVCLTVGDSSSGFGDGSFLCTSFKTKTVWQDARPRSLSHMHFRDEAYVKIFDECCNFL